MYICMHVCMYICMYVCTCIYMYVEDKIIINSTSNMTVHWYTCVHTYIHTYMHTYMHTYIHTHTHTHIHGVSEKTKKLFLSELCQILFGRWMAKWLKLYFMYPFPTSLHSYYRTILLNTKLLNFTVSKERL